ncbi:hypothetical protein PHLGIDRAFT_18147 [Phlebiopsis gigantea 11061_1 CR5-6]|uniref:Uncharacterized protein n=1 Tax=Phlebiopsis gigantea (strain 11061_1 CR5-6) TaxID=745531 RepID=A0A0C3SEW9_PHLG1|nr:hypothetical protein PHLGIDRAFT_18147 [Phlebiopsis gigantea 11061_1 CR5-6]
MHPPQPPVPPQPSGVHTPQLTHPSPRTQSAQVNPSALPKKKPLISETAASSSTPPASASTPANPPTPGRAADSPQTPKSPRATKPVPKPKPKRRPSVKGQPPTPAASTSNAFVTPDHSSPAHPATPESTGTKRKREEEPIVIPQPSSEPSPGKKPRTEWEGTPSEELARKKQEVKAAGETDEDATQFLANTIEMLAMATSEGGQVPSEVTETIDQILRILPATDSSAGLPAFDSLVRDSSPIPAAADIGFPDSEWFDWNSYNDDDHGSKANTPDLVAPPSTNASPGSSGSEVGHGSSHDSACIADPSRGDDDPEARDSLRMGIWNEIGGEAAHYNQDLKWQWEGTMPTLDQPWAIMGSER